MNSDTINNDHWASELKHTERAANEYTEFVENTVSDAVLIMKNTLSKSNANNSSIYNNDMYEGIDFNVPFFSKKYSIMGNRSYTSKTQKWFGNVISIEEESFTALLEDLNRPGTKEIGQFDIYDISPDDKILLKKGAAFYWRIGYNDTNGQRRKESVIKFQRLGSLTMNEIDQIEDKAQEIYNSIIWDNQ